MMPTLNPLPRHLAELYRRAGETYGELPAFATRQSGGPWEPLTFKDLYERGAAIGTVLIELGVEAQEPVGLFSDNRVEWILADSGIQCCAAVNTPRGTDVTDAELIHIVNHSEMKLAFVETLRVAHRLKDLGEKLPELRTVVVLSGEDESFSSLNELEEKGRELRDQGDRRVEERAEALQASDLFTLIYTSGTTGVPKGVMLTHANMISQLVNVPLPLACTDRVTSILPVWHIFERMFEVLSISRGMCTYYTSARRLGDDLLQVEPTFMGSAPRLWESLHHRIVQGVRHSHPVRRGLFHIGYFLGRLHRESMFLLTDQDEWLTPPNKVTRPFRKAIHLMRVSLLLPWYGFFNVAVLETVRQKAGGNLKGTISGGGALPRAIDKFFTAIGIPVLEGYGLTETCPVLAVRLPGRAVSGTVGPLIPETELRIVDPESGEVLYPDPSLPGEGRGLRGEIQVRGPQVMKGYYKDPDLTRQVLDEDGWFRTGDLGLYTFNDCLKILGRSKATLVLSNGENVEPEPLETRLRMSTLVDQCMAVGQDARAVGVLIVPDPEGFAEAGVEADSLAGLCRMPEAQEKMKEEIHRIMTAPGAFKRYEQVRDFRFIDKPFEVGVELTNLHKLKRHVIEESYAEQIQELANPQTRVMSGASR